MRPPLLQLSVAGKLALLLVNHSLHVSAKLQRICRATEATVTGTTTPAGPDQPGLNLNGITFCTSTEVASHVVVPGNAKMMPQSITQSSSQCMSASRASTPSGQ